MKKMLFAGLLAIPLVGLCQQPAHAWFCYREYTPHIPIPVPIIPVIKPSFSFSCPACKWGGNCAHDGAHKCNGGACAHPGWNNPNADAPAGPTAPWYNYYPGVSSPATGSPYPAANPVYAPSSAAARNGQPVPSYWYGH